MSRYPTFDAYGREWREFPDSATAAGATRDERIASVWPFVAGRVLAFHKTLTARERVNFDPEDVLTELWVALAERDGQWTPERGRYITFAAVICDHELCAIRDKARTVEAPRNSTGRLKQYQREEEAGSITPHRLKTANDIRRTGGGISHSSGADDYDTLGADEDPAEAAALAEARAATEEGLRRALYALPVFEALIVGRTSGLWGRPRAASWAVAWEVGRSHAEVRRAKRDALLKIRDYLVAIEHPAAAG